MSDATTQRDLLKEAPAYVCRADCPFRLLCEFAAEPLHASKRPRKAKPGTFRSLAIEALAFEV